MIPSNYQISVEDVMNDMEYDAFEFESFGLEGLDIKGKAKALGKWILKQLKRLANFFKTLWNKVFNKEKKIEKTLNEIKSEIKDVGHSNTKITEKKNDQVVSDDESIKRGGFVAVIKADTKTPDTIVERLKKCDTTIAVSSEILSASIDAIKHISSLTVSDNGSEYIKDVMDEITRLNKIIEDKLDITEQLNYTKHFDVKTLGGSVKAIDEMFKAVVQINLGFKECSKLLDNAVNRLNAVILKRGIEGVLEGTFIDVNVRAMNDLSRYLYQQVTKAFNDLDTCSLAIKSYVKKLGGQKLESTESVESKIVEAIFNEYGIEGVTSIIKNLSK